MQDFSELSLEEIYNQIVENKKLIRKYGGTKTLYDFLSEHEHYKESIFIKDKAVNSFASYVANIKSNLYAERPLAEISERQDFEFLLNGIEDFLKDKNSDLFERTEQETDFIYLVGYYADVRISENKLTKFKKMIVALHTEKNLAQLHFFDSKDANKYTETGIYAIEDHTTVINIAHRHQRSSQIRLYNPSKSISRYLGGLGLVMYSSRYSEQVAMQVIFIKKENKEEAFKELDAENIYKVPPVVVPAVIEQVIQQSGERSSEFVQLNGMKDYLKYKHLESIKGVYTGYYLTQSQGVLDTLIVLILANGKSILLTDNKEEGYAGIINFADEANIVARFHYTGNNPIRTSFRFQFNLKEKDFNKKFLVGSYSGRGALTHEPMGGRMLLQRIENIPLEIQKYINEPNEKEEDEINSIEILRKNIHIKSYLLDIADTKRIDEEKGVYSILDLKKENLENFDTIISFFLGEQDHYVESFAFLEKYLLPLKSVVNKKTSEFKALKGFYYLYSFKKEGYLQYFTCNPVQIVENGTIRMLKMDSKTQIYTGKITIIGEKMAFSFTHLLDVEIFPLHFMSYIGAVYGNDEFIPTLSLTAISDVNPIASRTFLVKIKKDIKINSLEDLNTCRFTNYDRQPEKELLKYINEDVHKKITEFIHSAFNNIIKSTRTNSGIVQRKNNPWEVFFITAFYYAKKGDKQTSIKFLELAEQHFFKYYYTSGLQSTVDLMKDEEIKEAFKNATINFEGYLNIEKSLNNEENLNSKESLSNEQK